MFLFLLLIMESNIDNYNNKWISYHYNNSKSFVNYVVAVVINPWINPGVLYFFDNFYRRNLGNRCYSFIGVVVAFSFVVAESSSSSSSLLSFMFLFSFFLFLCFSFYDYLILNWGEKRLILWEELYVYWICQGARRTIHILTITSPSV